MPVGSATWHYGVVARWWAEFNVGGPEVDYFRRFIVDSGEPALDVGCGTGRLLLPYLSSGLDVDGCDVSGDMLRLCREAAAREGLAPRLYQQANHELRLPRRYRTIIVCGSFGLGASRAQDATALRRFHDHLEPGGRLVLDNEVPYSDAELWAMWVKGGRDELPEPWPATGMRRRASDGTDYELLSRIVAFDPLQQRLTREMRASTFRDGTPVETSEHRLDMTLYFANELLLMIEQAGFVDVDVRAGYRDAPPTAEDDFLVFVANRPTP
jgi:SAM-dependent methyltransferase